jgi:hypothetical protein
LLRGRSALTQNVKFEAISKEDLFWVYKNKCLKVVEADTIMFAVLMPLLFCCGFFWGNGWAKNI